MQNKSIDTLVALVQSLPTELYDEIYDLTFTAATGPRYPARIILQKPTRGTEREVHSDRRPIELVTHQFQGHDTIALLQVDHASREQFAKSYYGGPDALFMFNRRKDGERWLKSLNDRHRSYLRCIGLAVLSDGLLYPWNDNTLWYKLAIDREMFWRCFEVELRFTLSREILGV
ncbi:hypothetical protein M409DRAFT_26956 [Zasmidium cellare ATCC 36951]|uniref:Uncharacterized protein n=1 Tax=Zasmidium cellare ATCC 36951 TaxID=1080233 RepID=A0A6A6CAP8_ZASCE|nr:uncharacterized protein M409DRAFT_26956 [Zasmidium cellare ATCC 36951]KAF2162719.1 hypothetical protein M409DRAFT_26956 [Zasmidium cellare ATCC 36951]